MLTVSSTQIYQSWQFEDSFFFSFTGVKCIHFYFPKRFGKITVPLFWNRKSLTWRRNTLQASVPLQAVCGTATTRKDRLSVHITPPLLGKMKELQTALGFIDVNHRHICRSAVFGFTDQKKKKNGIGPFKVKDTHSLKHIKHGYFKIYAQQCLKYKIKINITMLQEEKNLLKMNGGACEAG